MEEAPPLAAEVLERLADLGHRHLVTDSVDHVEAEARTCQSPSDGADVLQQVVLGADQDAGRGSRDQSSSTGGRASAGRAGATAITPATGTGRLRNAQSIAIRPPAENPATYRGVAGSTPWVDKASARSAAEAASGPQVR